MITTLTLQLKNNEIGTLERRRRLGNNTKDIFSNRKILQDEIILKLLFEY